jgi:hypothetical protein
VKRIAAVLAGVGLLAAGCGGSSGPNARDVLKQTAAKIGQIRGGVLGLRLVVTPHGGGDPFGFELHGPFTLAKTGLPVTNMAYTQIANGQQATATLVSNGSDAHVELAGKRIALSPAQTDSLRQAAGQLRGTGKGGRLALDTWVKDAKASDGGDVGGAKTDKVEGKLDVAQAVAGLLEFARLSGRRIGQLTAADKRQLQDAVRSSSFVLYSGKDDRLLRKLQLAIDVGVDVPADLRSALGQLVGAKVDFELSVANPKR